MNQRSHKGVTRRQKEHLPFCPTLGPHHMNWEGRHFRTRSEKQLRNFGGFIMPLTVAPPPNHTLIHRSLGETPIPTTAQIHDMLDVARVGGLHAVVNTFSNPTIEHYNKQLYIASIDPNEAIGRLVSKAYVTEREMRGYL